MTDVVALFGEAERGSVQTAYFCKDLKQLFERFGEPPAHTQGLFFAVQTLLYGHPVVYFRVREEGSSFQDYLFGLHFLKGISSPILHLHALFLPGVGSQELIDEGLQVCRQKQSVLIMCEADFYDYLTTRI